MSRRKRKNLTSADVEVKAAASEAPPAEDPPAAEAATTAGSGGESSELERLQTEASEMRELAQRKQAEFENFRKRMERERLDLARYAGAEVVKEILPVLDNLERALRSGGSEEQLRDGVAIIHRQLQ
jgi:molecular chaperone GrpE